MKIKSNAGIFTFIFILWYATEILFNTTITEIGGLSIDVLNSAMNYVILGLLMLQILFFQKYEKKELIIIAMITIPIVISTKQSGYFVLLSAWMFIVASKNVKFEEVIRIAYTILRIMIPLIIILYFIGALEESTLYRNGVLRHSLGFSHPNQLGLRLFQLLVCNFYIHRKKVHAGNYIFALLLIVAAYFIPNSQTATICMGCVSVFVMAYVFFEKYSTSLMHLFKKLLIVIGIMSNLLSVVWSVCGVEKYEILKQIDQWMSIRFSTCHKVFQLFGSSLWGQHLYITSAERALVGIRTILFLDNAYMALMLRMGVIVYVIFTVAYIGQMMILRKKDNNILLIILVVYAIYGIMENGFFALTHNIFLLAFSDMLYRKDVVVEQRV